MSSHDNNFHWWQTGVIYQIYPRSFKDSSGDGVGDLQGIIDKLDYLNGSENSLGIDAIWISPIYPSPMADFGYDVSDYVDIHPLFGNLETFDRLVAEAHQRGIKVILDYVPNHTSDEHPWFIESSRSRDNPRHDWYIWRDGKANSQPPNNWASMFGGSAWKWSEARQQYYLHLFLDKQPDLNWRNPAVKAAMLAVQRFWLARGVDGCRMDVVGFMIKDEALRDNPVKTDVSGLSPNNLWDRQEHVYDIDQPGVHDIIREFRQLHDSYGDRVIIGEIWAYPRSRWALYYGKNGDELHLPFNFDLLNKPWQAAAMRASVDELEAALPPGAWPNYVLGSHDISRLASRFGPHAVRVAAMLLLTLRGTPTLYLGDELGMVNGVIPPDRVQDPPAINIGPEKGRDPNRTPFQWSAGAYAGFSTLEPWLPVADGYQTCNVETELRDLFSVLNLYRTLLDCRRNTPALNRGSYQPVDGAPKDCFVYIREYGGNRVLLALNFGGAAQTLSLGSLGSSGQLEISTAMDRRETIDLTSLKLRPYEGIVITLSPGV